MLSLHYQDGLIPVVVQDQITREVLMVAYANSEAVGLTASTGFSHFYSRSRKKIWKKGEELLDQFPDSLFRKEARKLGEYAIKKGTTLKTSRFGKVTSGVKPTKRLLKG